MKKKAKEPIKEIEIVASYSGKVATGRFENENPFFSIKEIRTGGLTDEEIKTRQKELSEICYQQFTECEQRSQVDRIMHERKDLRFYAAGKDKFPSITSVIGWDKDFFISQEELLQYAARGTIVHKQIELYLKTGKWVPAKEIVEVHKEFVVVKKGSLSLDLEGYRIDKFIEKFKLETLDTETVSYNYEHRYAGRRDWKGRVDGVLSLIDWKTSKDLDKKDVLQQLAAHLYCPDNLEVQQVIAVPVNNTTEQGYSKPLIMKREEMGEYFELFLKSRANFKYRFGV